LIASTIPVKQEEMMQKMKMLLVLSMALLLSACASTQRLSDSDRSGLKAVTVSADVKKGRMFLLAPGAANIGLMFGAVGGLAASGSLEAGQAAFSTFVDAHAVSIDNIVREEFEKVLRDSGKVTVAKAGTRGVPIMTIAVRNTVSACHTCSIRTWSPSCRFNAP
jgi:hypothetical protein